MERIGDEIGRGLQRAGGGYAVALAEITAAWPRAVGAAIARNAWPLRLARDGTLHVATSSSTWAFELERMSGDLVASLAEVVGEPAPARLRFRPGPLPEHGAEPTAPPPRGVADPTAEVASAAAAAAAEIEDPDLRALVARAARASLSGDASGTGSDRGFW
jgi:predicted nucleic acid-binding Zn ribbon protein